eukprot:58884_1
MASRSQHSYDIELCILCDATLSMGPFLNQVKEDIDKIVTESRAKFGVDSFRVGFVAYRDWTGDGQRLESLSFTSNIHSFQTFVSNLKAEGGDDAAEDVLGGLQSAIHLEWSAPIKILYHICDAPPHGTIYHDLFDTNSQKIDSMLSTLKKMMAMKRNDDDDDKTDEDDDDSSSEFEDLDEDGMAFVGSKLNLDLMQLNDDEKLKLDRFPDKHPQDPDHKDLLKAIKDKGIIYCIGEKTCHLDKWINIMMADAQQIDLKIHRMEIPSIKQLFGTVIRTIEYALRLSNSKPKRNKHFRPLQMDKKGNFKVHCGIDFGTDGSAIALSLANKHDHKKSKVHIYQWGSNKEYTKTKTNILLSAKGEVMAFGTNAAEIYSNCVNRDSDNTDSDSDEEFDEYHYKEPMFFEHFKMLLYGEDDEEKENRDMAQYITAVGGKKYPSAKVLDAALRFMKDKVLEIVAQKPYFIDDIDSIQWILSVPAIWSNEAKYIMERCAQNAGMIHKRNPIQNHLLIAYEPDCASISIRNAFKDILGNRRSKPKTKSKPQTNSKGVFERGDKYLLVDLGGGTADFACHEVVDDYHVKQIRAPSGGPWGSTYIDKEFEKLLKVIFCAKWIKRFESKYPEKYVELLRSFRYIKERFYFEMDFEDNVDANNMEMLTMSSQAFMQYASENKEEDERQYFNIKLPFEFVEEMEIYIEKQLRAKNDDSDDDDEVISNYLSEFRLFNEYKHLVQYEDGTLRLEESVFRYLFDKIIDKIMEHCHRLLSEPLMADAAYICLVGGFSGSRYLQSKIYYQFGAKTRFEKRILTPKRPILCVVDGAARYGIRPDYITSRSVSKTYGVGIQKSVSEFKRAHPDMALDDKQMSGDKQWINDCFFAFVHRNEMIRLNEEPKVFYFENADEHADKIIIQLYETHLMNPIFTNQDNVKLCAQKEIKLPKGWFAKQKDSSNSIPVAFYFGDSKIRVFVDLECIDNKNEKEITLDFNTSVVPPPR